MIGYLFGSREAILALATNRNTIWLGLIFVISAGFAREYDGEDLRHEPWHLLLPLVASLGTSFILFWLVALVGWGRGAGLDAFGSRYPAFLGLYWMTAPLAWLYAIPVEQFFSAGAATAANLWFLKIVSIWRVALITRVFSILYSAAPGAVIFPVMLFADTLALTLVSYVDVQLLAVMGGVRLSESEAALAETKLGVLFLGVLSWPIWFFGTWTVSSSRWSKWSWAITERSSKPIAASVWAVAAVAVLVWWPILPWTQPAQALRGLVERDLRAGKYAEALATMSAHSPRQFPPHWDPPPRIGARGERKLILKIVPALQADTAPWVRQVFLDKLDAALGRNDFPMETLWLETDVGEILQALQSQPEGAAILSSKWDILSRIRQWEHVVPPERGQEVDRLLIQILEAPAKLPEASREQPWSSEYILDWRRYLHRVEHLKEHEQTLQLHGPRIKKLLEEPNVPDEIQTHAKRVLEPLSPSTVDGPTAK